MRICWCVLVLLTVALSEGRAQAPLDSAHDQIARWVAQLDSDLFDTRERAQKELTRAGMDALDAVTTVARSGTLESSTRAINILLAWSESDEGELVIAALERLSDLEDHPKQAKLARELLATVRETLALKSFKELGGTFHMVQPANGMIMPRQMRNLQVIIGSGWKGGVEGLKLLEQMPSITIVSFHCPPLGDEALDVLETLPQLRRVELYGTKRINPEAIAELPKKLPGVRPDQIDVRGPAFLGVRGTIFGENAQVGAVVPGSAAHVAGLKPGDIIDKLNGKDIKDFVTLTTLISEHEVGDSVILGIIRPRPNAAPETLELKVTFAQWGVNGAGATPAEPAIPTGAGGAAAEPGRIQLERR